MFRTTRAGLAGLAFASLLVSTLPAVAADGRWPRLRAVLADCGPDIARLCPDVVPGGGRIAQCLTDRLDRLAPACRSHLEKGRAVRTVMLACAGDADRLCPGVVPGGGRIGLCLMARRDELTSACRTAIDEVEATGLE